MTRHSLEMIFEHNNWANNQIIEACSALTDEQLDAEPKSATRGNLRTTLTHLVLSQEGYLRLLTKPLEEWQERIPVPPITELKELAYNSGEALLAIARDEAGVLTKEQLQTRDGFLVVPWVVMLQVINHATEHREQIKSMLTALGVTPPEIDGWSFGEFTKATIPLKTEDAD